MNELEPEARVEAGLGGSVGVVRGAWLRLGGDKGGVLSE